MVHLDTNIVVAYLRGHQGVAARIESALPGVALSAIVLAELLYGVRVSARPDENRARLVEFLQLVDVLDFNRACADAYAVVRYEQRRLGRPSGEADALIASTAIAHGATIITHNARHFEGLVALPVEDWLPGEP